ncbi:MAG: DMT family transporter [Anaerolineaceae bacterium]
MSSKPAARTDKKSQPNGRPSVFPQVVVMLGVGATSTAAILIRLAQQGAPSLVIAAYRMVLATLILSPLAIFLHRKELKSLKQGDIRWLALSGFFLALHFATWISSLQYTSVASAVVLVATNPLWVGLFSWLFLKEKINRWVVVGMLVALMGGLLISLSDATGKGGIAFSGDGSGRSLWGDFLALLGALFGAGYIIIGRKLRAFTSLPVYTFMVYGVAGVMLLITVIAVRLPLTGYEPQTYLWFLLLALVPQLIGHSSINWGLRYLSAAFVAIVLLSEPIGSSLLAVFLLHETPTAVKVAGGVLILLGIGIASLLEHGKTSGGIASPD